MSKIPMAKEGMGFLAISYVAVDYLRYVYPSWHGRLMVVLWVALAVAALLRLRSYRHWSAEIRAFVPFLLSIVFLLSCFLLETICVRFVTAVLGLDWHRSASPLPDTGQWLLLALNEKLPVMVVEILRAHIITLHHYLMLFMMLAFSVLFKSVKAPGFGLAARYIVTLGIGRILRTITFVSTILPSLRPWCADTRYQVPQYQVPQHPHPWAQKYYIPYASNSNAIRRLIRTDTHYAAGEYHGEYQPNWGRMSFLIDILRPTMANGSSWFQLLKGASGGCNDLMYSGHILVAVLTAMAWTEAYGGWTSVTIWLLVLHSAQREVRERHHYSVDCVAAIYVGILLWKMTGYIWSCRDTSKLRKLAKLDEIQRRLEHAAKDCEIDDIRELLREVELAGQERHFSERAISVFVGIAVIFAFGAVLLALILTSDG